MSIDIVLAVVMMTSAAGVRPAGAALAAEINRAALASDSLQVRDGKVILYGQQTNGPDTRRGKWACAKVVSIVLRKAGVPIAVELGVGGVERSLKGWRRIADKSQLRPGDVVVWTNRFKGNDDRSCTGKGTCHIGIYTSDGYFHNDPLGDKPIFGGIGLLGFSFKIAFRPPG